jgi:hypothetical protein
MLVILSSEMTKARLTQFTSRKPMSREHNSSHGRSVSAEFDRSVRLDVVSWQE